MATTKPTMTDDLAAPADSGQGDPEKTETATLKGGTKVTGPASVIAKLKARNA